jgi:hypothetical protein
MKKIWNNGLKILFWSDHIVHFSSCSLSLIRFGSFLSLFFVDSQMHIHITEPLTIDRNERKKSIRKKCWRNKFSTEITMRFVWSNGRRLPQLACRSIRWFLLFSQESLKFCEEREVPYEHNKYWRDSRIKIIKYNTHASWWKGRPRYIKIILISFVPRSIIIKVKRGEFKGKLHEEIIRETSVPQLLNYDCSSSTH